ncbi:MAG: hypothetical protein ABJA66_07270 [Actinomycetota bacterium]
MAKLFNALTKLFSTETFLETVYTKLFSEQAKFDKLPSKLFNTSTKLFNVIAKLLSGKALKSFVRTLLSFGGTFFGYVPAPNRALKKA